MNTLFIVGCAIAALLSAGNLVQKKASIAHLYLAALFADVACALAMSAWRLTASIGATGVSAPVLSLLAIGGILINRIFILVARLETEHKRAYVPPLLLLVPAVLSDVLVHGFHLHESVHPAWLLTIQGLHLVVGLSVLLLCVGSIIHVFRLYSLATMTKTAWSVLTISASGTIALTIGLTGLVIGSAALFEAMDAYLSVAVLAIALLSFRYPEAFRNFHQQTVTRRYARSLLKGLDVDGLASGMKDMVRKTSLFKDENCSLDELSRRMGLSVHQVSELLNDRMGTNFSGFINGFRVEAARELLTSRRDMTILAIALEVGFGNKTSFNETFKRLVHLTPRQFRATHATTRQDI